MTDTPPRLPADQAQAGPILRSVTLYKHGMGAFHWTAVVGEDGTLALPVPSQQIDDVLKSLLVLAADGSSVASISYAADEPLQRQLSNFGVNLEHIGGFADLLRRMVGATVRFQVGGAPLEGQIIATEVVDRYVQEKLIRDEWVLLLANGMIERIELGAVRGLEIVRGETADRLATQLDLLRTANQRDVVRLVFSAPPGTTLELRYVAEAPVWKMTYRVVLPVEGQAELFFQGWAIAENTSASDWNGVELALISGMPLSFTLDLRHPRFRSRPAASIPEVETIAPPVSEGLMTMPTAAGGPAFAEMAYAAEPAPDMLAAKYVPRRGRIMTTALAAAPPPPTTTRSVGDLFEYHLDHPVVIPAQQAALIPVIAGQVAGEAVSVYNASVHANHPLSAVRLRNSTGLTLDAGPITVMRGDTYVGEALIDVIKPDEDRLISYAVDLGCRVESQQQTGQRRMVRVRIRRGVLRYDLRETATTTYRFQSLTDDQRTVVVEHPVRAGWDLPEPPPQETTATYRRYQVAVAPRQAAVLVVRESQTLEESMTLLQSGLDQILWIIAQTGHDPQAVPVLEQIAAQFRAVSEREAAVNRLQAELDRVEADQGRLRSNLQALGQGREERELARRYVDELARSEDRLAELQANLAKALQAAEQATAALHAFVEGADLDQPLAVPSRDGS